MKPDSNPFPWPRSQAGLLLQVLLAVGAGFTAGCRKEDSVSRLPGYVEGEYVYVAAPSSGKLEKLSVARGDQVPAGSALFNLDPEPEKSVRDEAARQLEKARATLADLRKGSRPSEIASMEAALAKIHAAMEFSASQVVRQEKLNASRAGSTDDLERARSADEQNRNEAAQLQADLETARLGARPDQILASEGEVQAREAALARTDWDLKQKGQTSQQAGQVFDTLYREGEWIPAGRPVVALLPPLNVKVRVWVPEAKLSTLHKGGTAQVWRDGEPQPVTGRVTFLSPQAEYAPPVIYSQEVRQKFLYMVELRFDDSVAAGLHPGQPVDVEFAP